MNSSSTGILGLARPQDTVIVAGSLILVGQVKKHLAHD